jgi:hypothetical protein
MIARGIRRCFGTLLPEFQAMHRSFTNKNVPIGQQLLQTVDFIGSQMYTPDSED